MPSSVPERHVLTPSFLRPRTEELLCGGDEHGGCHLLHTQSVSEWKKKKIPPTFPVRPTIFFSPPTPTRRHIFPSFLGCNCCDLQKLLPAKLKRLHPVPDIFSSADSVSFISNRNFGTALFSFFPFSGPPVDDGSTAQGLWNKRLFRVNGNRRYRVSLCARQLRAQYLTVSSFFLPLMSLCTIMLLCR